MEHYYSEGVIEKMQVTIPSADQEITISLKIDSAFAIKDKEGKEKVVFLHDAKGKAILLESSGKALDGNSLLCKFKIEDKNLQYASLLLSAKNNRNKIRIYIDKKDLSESKSQKIPQIERIDFL